MNNTDFASKVKAIVSDARELSEAWAGTLIADKLVIETEAVVKGVEDKDFTTVQEILLPQLLSTIGFAHNRLEHQEA